MLDARSSAARDTTIQIKVYHRLGGGWEKTFPLKVHELLWSDNIPAAQGDMERILNDGSLLWRAKRIDITRQDQRAVAVVMKEAGASPFILDPEAYRTGLPGRGRLETQLILEEFRIVVNVRHSDDPAGRNFCFRLANIGKRLEQLNMSPLRPHEAPPFLRGVSREFE
ncbi:MAG: hypothetical protein HYY01_07820 [Chloroflexi bacterium]|nr:hypothetical protein [Chloroflexota bacterium]